MTHQSDVSQKTARHSALWIPALAMLLLPFPGGPDEASAPWAGADVYVTAQGTGDRLTRKAGVTSVPVAQPDEHMPTVVLDRRRLFQTIVGIGGALTDASAETFSKLPPERREEILLIGHFSKFIRPGARRMVASSNWDPLLATAFVNTDGKIAVVVMNPSEASIDFQTWMEGRAVTTASPARSIMTILL